MYFEKCIFLVAFSFTVENFNVGESVEEIYPQGYPRQVLKGRTRFYAFRRCSDFAFLIARSRTGSKRICALFAVFGRNVHSLHCKREQ